MSERLTEDEYREITSGLRRDRFFKEFKTFKKKFTNPWRAAHYNYLHIKELEEKIAKLQASRGQAK